MLLLLACVFSPDRPEPIGLTVAAQPEAAREAEPESSAGLKASGHLPQMTESELAAEDARRRSCVSTCLAAERAEDVVTAEPGCQASCLKTFPIQQVEIVSDPP